MPQFSDAPTTQEIFRARVFEEPLVPTTEPSAAANISLVDALRQYLAADKRDDIRTLLTFLEKNPESPWQLALLTNLAIVTRHTGYYSRSMEFSSRAWELGRNLTDRRHQALADRAFAELVEMYARVGEMEKLQELFNQTKGRSFGGAVGARVAAAREGLAIMRTSPETAFRCGPLAVQGVMQALRPGTAPIDPATSDSLSSARGTSLTQIKRLADSLNLGLTMAFRPAGTASPAELLADQRTEAKGKFPVPSVVHWRAGHFAAIVQRSGDRYYLQDPTFGESLWVNESAIEEEATGYFLVRSVPSGWRAVAEAEGAQIFGKGAPSGEDPEGNTPEDKMPCEPCQSGQGMATYQFFGMQAALAISDIPIGYRPPKGPSVSFKLSYSQTEISQPSIFFYSNVGPMWTIDWFSYVVDDPSTTSSQTLRVYRQGGGQETHNYSSGSQSSPEHYRTRARVFRTTLPPTLVRYERRLPDGSKEVFEQPDGSLSFPRRVLMTEKHDPQGNTLRFVYDGQLRLTALVDAVGQVTLFSYEFAGDPLKITRITDPFGRSASLDYDAAGRLVRITDTIGLTSSFTYGPGDFVTSLTTPYGTTRFETGVNGTGSWIQATDPLGGVEKYYQQVGHSTLNPVSDDPATVPGGYQNDHLDQAVTFHWNRRLMSLAPNDFSKAEQTHWLWKDGRVSTIPRAKKMPLENRVWYRYPGQTDQLNIGTHAQPREIARRLSATVGDEQVWKYEYNAQGMMTKSIDPLNREMVYEYDASGLDRLVTKRKKAGGLYDTLETRTYNAAHQPLTITDASGDVTTFTYENTQVKAVQTPPPAGFAVGPTTTYTYDSNRYLTTIAGPVAGATTTFTYDAQGRLKTTTDSTGYTTTTTYDSFDRPARITHPDTTFEQMEYEKLDLVGRKDRLGRWTRTVYDPLRRAISVRDPNNGVTTYQWCDCGTMDALVDANGNRTAWEYDLQSRVVKETRANGAATTYSYQPATSRLSTRTDRRGVVTTYTYLKDNQLDRKVYSSLPGTVAATPDVVYTYDTYTGLPLTAANGTDTLSWLYDTEDRMLHEESTLNATRVAWAYDGAGNRSTVALGASGGTGTTFNAYTYDVTSRLTRVRYKNTHNFDFAYDTSSRRTSMTYPNGIVTTYTPYDAESRVTRINAKLGATNITDFNYGYNAVGNRTFKNTLEFNEDYRYDVLDRLVSANRPSAGTKDNWLWTYDKVGNRVVDQKGDTTSVLATQSSYNNLNQLLSKSATGQIAVEGSTNESATVTVNTQPTTTTSANTFTGTATAVPPAPGASPTPQTITVQATDPSGNVRTSTYSVPVASLSADETYAYDANGNLTSKVGSNGTWTYRWDAENRLVDVKVGATTQATFRYDPNDRRVEKVAGGTTFRFVYDNEDWIRRTGGMTMDIVHGPGIDEPMAQDVGTTMTYFHADALGSIQKHTSAAGAVTTTVQYDAWGEALAGAPAPYGFTGREPDAETGLHYYRARYYVPSIARFANEDPIQLRGGVNFYAYVAGRPVNAQDPSGTLLYICSRISGVAFRHLFFCWKDKTGPGAPYNSCGKGGASGDWTPSGGGGGSPTREACPPTDPHTQCSAIPESAGKEQEILDCCLKPSRASSGYGPADTCFEYAWNCMTASNVKDPGGYGGKWGPEPPCSTCKPNSAPPCSRSKVGCNKPH